MCQLHGWLWFNSKNTLDKNYLWFAEQWGTKVEAETKVVKVEYKEDCTMFTRIFDIMVRKRINVFSKPRNRFCWSLGNAQTAVQTEKEFELSQIFLETRCQSSNQF